MESSFFSYLYLFSRKNSHPCQEKRTVLCVLDHNVTTLRCNYINKHKKTVLLSFHQVSGSDVVTRLLYKGEQAVGVGERGAQGGAQANWIKKLERGGRDFPREFMGFQLHQPSPPLESLEPALANDGQTLDLWVGLERGKAGTHREASPRGSGSLRLPLHDARRAFHGPTPPSSAVFSFTTSTLLTDC